MRSSSSHDARRRPILQLLHTMRTLLKSFAFCAAAAACSHGGQPATSTTAGSSMTTTEHDNDDDPSAPPKSAAKLTEDQAKAIATAKVPGDIKESELEREHGHLIYSIEIKPTGQAKGVKEVNVDAIDGSIVNIEDESGEEDEGGEVHHAEDSEHD